MAIRLLHLADLHLDSALPLPAGFERLQNACLEALTRAVSVALHERVDAVLMAGDLYERRQRSIRARLHLQKELGRLHEAGIPSFIVHGNHDPLDDVPTGISLPPSTTVFGNAVREVPVLRDGRPWFRVQGISFDRPHVSENLTAHFARQGPEPTVGVLHCNVGTHPAHANYAPCTVDDLDRTGFDYWALGHVHTRQTFVLRGGGVAAYPGNLQGRHLKEVGPRGAVLIELDEHRRHAPRLRFVACDVVRWQRLAVDVDGVDTIDGVIEATDRARQALAEESDERPHLVAITLRGRTGLHGQLTAAALSDLTAALDEHFRPAGWAAISVDRETRPRINLEALEAAGGLTGALARGVRTPGDASTRALFGDDAGLTALLGQLAGLGVAVPDPTSIDVYERAAALALDSVLEAEG